jgi:diguanylate cyclase (GGDEF)-like protein
MYLRDILRSASFAGLVCLASFASSGAATAAPDDAALLKSADALKTADNPEAKRILDRLNSRFEQLSRQQQTYLRFLEAWQAAYEADYTTAIPKLNAIIAESADLDLRFRAGMTAVNVLGIARRYEEAYARLNEMLELLPQVTDTNARRQGLNVASFLYERAGQYDLAIRYANEVIELQPEGNSVCIGETHLLRALYESGKLQIESAEFERGISACSKVNEPLWANFIRSDLAKLYLAHGKYNETVKLLSDHYDEVERARYAELSSLFDSLLARAYWKLGNAAQAQKYARGAIDKHIKGEMTEATVYAYDVLYEISKQQGDFENALAYHEKYAAADKGYLNDTSARTLAFQMVNQQVLDKKRQIDALNEKNERLQLRQQVDVKTAETARLYILLLIVVLASIAFWAYKTKRSQLRFMRLARRDGLTGIFNRQHFLDAAGDQLRYCAKSARDACVVVIDLDHFKSVNDVYGHATGDLVLKRAVKTCEDHLRSIDIFGRLGGEEFGIVLPDCPIEQALACAEQLRKAITDVSGSDARIDFPVSASFGIAATHTSGYDLRELLANADSALYEAKREGRNRIASYQSSATVKSVQAAAKAASTH